MANIEQVSVGGATYDIMVKNPVPIEKGGTNAESPQEARTNLGFTYGSADPEGTPSTGEGSVYFRTGGDVVVDEGTSGIWTYRKWASGIAECWGSYKYSGITCNSAWGGLYESAGQTLPNYPFTFAEVPHQTLSIRKTDTYAMMLRGPYSTGSVTTTKAGGCGFIRPSSTSSGKDVEVSIHAIGRWKV